MADKQEILEALKDHAKQNYETGGWDYLVETWTDEEILEEFRVENIKTYGAALKHFRQVLGIRDQVRSDIRGEIF